jgi:hypothetical protein
MCASIALLSSPRPSFTQYPTPLLTLKMTKATVAITMAIAAKSALKILILPNERNKSTEGKVDHRHRKKVPPWSIRHYLDFFPSKRGN